MSIIEKVFKYEETELSVIKRQDDIWYRGKTTAEILGYSNPLEAICTHVDSEDKKEMSKLEPKSRGAQNGHPFNPISTGLFCLVLALGGCFPPPFHNSFVFKDRLLKFCTEILSDSMNNLR